MALHLVSVSPFSNNALNECLDVFDLGKDALLLIGDGTYAVQFQHDKLYKIEKCHRLYALQEDLKLRGLDEQKTPAINSIDYEAFVELTENHQNLCSWY